MSTKTYVLRNDADKSADDITFARKDSAVRAAERLGWTDWTVFSPSGVVVAGAFPEQPAAPEEPETPVADEPEEDLIGELPSKATGKAKGAAKAAAPAKPAKVVQPFVEGADKADWTHVVVGYADFAPKIFWSALGVAAANRLADVTDVAIASSTMTITVINQDAALAEAYATVLETVWQEAMEELPAWKKTNTAFAACDLKKPAGRQEALRLVRAHLTDKVDSLTKPAHLKSAARKLVSA